MLLNVIPLHLSGLKKQYTPGGEMSEIANWYGSLGTLDATAFERAFTFVVVTEQLKRLDVLLRQTEIINTGIETMVHVYLPPNWAVETKTEKGEVVKLIEWLGMKHPTINNRHPIVYAAYNESARIGNLLNGLRSGSTDISGSALRSLLDSFRNALAETWTDTAAAKGQAERTLIVRVMELLDKIIRLPQATTDNKPLDRKVDFTVMLAYIQRLWSVSWKWGSVVLINAVKSRVISDSVAATTLFTTVSTTPNLRSRFGVKTDETVASEQIANVAKTVDPTDVSKSPLVRGDPSKLPPIS
jgi:hypothetical protein